MSATANVPRSATANVPNLHDVNVERVENELIPWLEAHLTEKGVSYLCRVTIDEDVLSELLDPSTESRLSTFEGGKRAYCCLGGASEAMIEHGEVVISRVLVQDWNSIEEKDVVIVRYDDDEVGELLGETAQDYYGLASDPPLQRADGLWVQATEWNDWGPNGVITHPNYYGDEEEDESERKPEPDFTQIIEGFRRMVAEAKRQQGAS